MTSLLSKTAKSVIVTGAASGLGKAIATEFLRLGSHVTLVDINAHRLKATSEELSAYQSHVTVTADITTKSDVRAVFQQAVSSAGQVDALVNCAGIVDDFQGAGELDTDLWNRVVAVNLTAPFLLSGEAVREFLRKKNEGGATGGIIINISSLAGLRGGFSGAAYAATKSGLLGLTKNTAALYAKKGIRCNAICPGGMATNIMEKTSPDLSGSAWGYVNKMNEICPGLVDVNKLGRLVAFLCSEDAININGAVITVDNGWNAI
ncbi:short-chain dehydrogenase/reductase SDR [Ilyonectria robusta]|uniref:short-chain dehydrogenase/reductase SDR n=1 Tax=Ilyonectria robusta TaxID=1079257 RepID=UPI001E8E5DBA|nr:short-chain dehydrogenase/reductase SDR [Ilyonectria robusta]KAH8729891.1 short-chain dehydrogenase/reductase SDR [Ilyonectria robusta]